ncbi:hypothetical protein ACF8MH_14390 [Pseudomonas sp. YQ_13]
MSNKIKQLCESRPLHGVQGGECSNHSVPTKKLQRIQALTGAWIFLCPLFFMADLKMIVLVANWLPIEIGLKALED